MENQEKSFALLIDADNISAKYVKLILNELSQYGNITYKRIYGDWTSTLHAKWKDELVSNSITPVQQFSYTTGKNATDSAMIIDAMDILYTRRVDGFCIVSSDSDFTRLASRLREDGMTVVGMGEKKTPLSFRKACDVFTSLEVLLDEEDNETEVISKEEIEEAIVSIITENENNDKKTALSEIGSRLLKRYPDFDVRSYGFSLLSKFLEEFEHFYLTRTGNIVTVSLTNDTVKKSMIDQFVVDTVRNAGKSGKDLAQLGNEVHAQFKTFRSKDYGYTRFIQYVKSIKEIRIEKRGLKSRAYFKK